MYNLFLQVSYIILNIKSIAYKKKSSILITYTSLTRLIILKKYRKIEIKGIWLNKWAMHARPSSQIAILEVNFIHQWLLGLTGTE